MKYFVSAALLVLSTVGSYAVAQGRSVFVNPCERGPLPYVSIINDERARFVVFLQDVRPRMPAHVALEIADQMCADMRLVGDSEGLTNRLNSLLRSYGY